MLTTTTNCRVTNEVDSYEAVWRRLPDPAPWTGLPLSSLSPSASAARLLRRSNQPRCRNPRMAVMLCPRSMTKQPARLVQAYHVQANNKAASAEGHDELSGATNTVHSQKEGGKAPAARFCSLIRFTIVIAIAEGVLPRGCSKPPAIATTMANWRRNKLSQTATAARFLQVYQALR